MAENTVNWDDCLDYDDVSDIGMRRANNQDARVVVVAGTEELWRHRGHLFIVADGMGAHAAGELASKLAVDGIPHHYRKYKELSAPEALQRAILETNAEVHRRGQANTDFHNMGTTVSALVLLPQGALVAHVGDSRVYRLRGETLEQLTFDHSLVWEMRAANQLPPDSDVATAIPKNVITRSLGPNATVQVDIEGPYPLEVGDTFLLCSDGLTGEVPDEELGPILANLPPKEAAQMLVDLANLRGGPDNITVIVARVTGDRLSAKGQDGQPITIGARKSVVQPALWIVAAVCLLVAGILWLTANPVPALIVLIGAVGVVAVAGWQYLRHARGGISLTGGRRLGKGPHVQVRCPANEQFMYKLAGIIQELRDAAMQRDWVIDWHAFDSYCRDAEEARLRSNHPDAVRSYARGISFMMEQLRNQQKRDGD